MLWELVSQPETRVREIGLPKVLGAPMTRVENSGEDDEVAQAGRRGGGETHGRPWQRKKRDER